MHLLCVTVQYSTEALVGVPKCILTETVKITAFSNRGIEKEMGFQALMLKKELKKKNSF